ncbi:DUF4253 domain-containing protein [Streptomyces sp. NPDC000594]|uniref:DUF4253 domain-containing protein n=1 Tax=Streptomyces sp. NPDC000594 TaxID=3154261 RepID=UPI003324BA7C
MNLELLRSAGVVLPPGRMITSDEDGGDARPPLWLSDGPDFPLGLWGRIRAVHERSGLWPLLLVPLEGDESFRPWATGELEPGRMSSPDSHDPSALLARWWQCHTHTGDEDDPLAPAARAAVTAPFGRSWPGPARAGGDITNADAEAVEYAEFFASFHARVRLGLVAAARGADALALLGWEGPVNYEGDTGTHAAVVRDWEERFGVRVVGIGFATLHLSVAAPPADREAALAVAAEHFAFCPDNVWQGPRPQSLASYADRLIGANCWEFWWD